MTRRRNRHSTLASRLAGKGIRLTRQRQLLLELIEGASEHLHASDLLRMAREKEAGIDRATVYRTLSLLKSQGLIEELDLLHLDGSEHHYELKDSKGHVHIGCMHCGKIIEFQTNLIPDIEKEIQLKTGCQVGSTRVEVSALCPKCRLE